MRKTIVSISLLLGALTFASAQQSPPSTETVSIGGKTVTVKYAAPSVRGREGKLFGKDGRIASDPGYPVWRAGANAATLLTAGGTLQIGSLSVPAGSYTLFVNIEDPNNWELIVNKQTGQWGLRYDKSQDLGRVKMTMSKPAAMVEKLKYTLADAGGGKGKLTLEWENHSASVSFTVK
ncbi:MAG: DUF2911 domain-containing protein [Bryobacterales bacterium]|nr:DUF2911 domain-containing protein [Bryobacterales bacterium]